MTKRTERNIAIVKILLVIFSGLLILLVTFLIGKNSTTENYRYIAYTGGKEVMLYWVPDENIELEELRAKGCTIQGERMYVIDPDIYSATGFRFAAVELPGGRRGYVPFTMLDDVPNVPFVSDSLNVDVNDCGYSYQSESGYHWSYSDFPEIAKAVKKSQQR